MSGKLHHVLRLCALVRGDNGLIHYRHISKGLWCTTVGQYIPRSRDERYVLLTCLWCCTGASGDRQR